MRDVRPLDLLMILNDRYFWEKFGGDEALYLELADDGAIPIGVGRRCGVFWKYEDVPRRLRGTFSLADLDTETLSLARARWLLGLGSEHLAEGEAEELRETLDEYDASG